MTTASTSYDIQLAHKPQTSSAPDFERLVGKEGWARLRPAIRRRFSDHDLRVTYPGELWSSI